VPKGLEQLQHQKLFLPCKRAVSLLPRGSRASAIYLEEGAENNVIALTDACSEMEVYADKIETERGRNFRALQFFQKTMLKGQEYSGYGVPIALRAISEIYRKLYITDS